MTRIRRGVLLGAAAMLALAGACTRATRQAGVSRAASRPYVVLVSFDAFRHDYIDTYGPPALIELASRGVSARALIPSFPSKTFPNHYTLVTGLYPGHHGIVGNTFYDPARHEWYKSTDPRSVTDSSWYSGEPLWATAERNGVRAGVFFWPGSEAAIGGIRPTYWTTYDQKVPNSIRVDSVVAWLRKPERERPHLVMLYISEVDDSTHKHGPNSAQTGLAIASVDRALRRLLDSLHALPFGDSANVVVVSDHGMLQVIPQRVIAVGDLLARAGVDTAGMRTSDNGPTMSIWFDGDSIRIRAGRGVLTRDAAHARTYLRSETPERWHVRESARAGDLLVVADEGYFLQRRKSDKPPNPGQHGYDPTVGDMQGIFLAAGPGVRRLGVIPAFENVNVYPFVAALLKLDHVPRTDGSLSVLLRALQ
ncbi:MAG: ectonucleotide pyrophosphatase/phosphodiesterase [bacterium]